MTRHSKNCTSSAIFTSTERSKLEYGIQEVRAGKDSFRSIDSCCLCLHRATEPVLCCSSLKDKPITEVHLHCRPCILDSMLAQAQANKAKMVAYEHSLAQKAAKDAKEKASFEEARLERFKLEAEGKVFKSDDAQPKQKRIKASTHINAYWIPSKTPDAGDDKEAVPERPPSKEIYCKATATQHPISMKGLQPVYFDYSTSSDKLSSKSPQCPICLKALSNATPIITLVPCGHVCCQPCVNKFLITSTCQEHICPRCEKTISHTLPTSRDGTGFAAGPGNVLVRKYDVAFQ